ncbi:M24 family metallopeptidase [Paenibacillus physcomitrellae]|uniref:Xaa-Pro dipeptidase n=1 Tax=Paenibacillus physcomitrellae TaxID=1619311 RepID=A0ABQ1FM61_9BACL|nr:Xaa-Pro peptidase family protein [Paenibacillus physcomitrellae]GGA22305.1 Xaa-Pro dipeptidase [Paenibacillus physcomitrellae]
MDNQRVSKVRKALLERQLDGLLVASPINRQYLTGFTGSAGYVLITADKAYLLTDFRYMTQAPQQAVDFEVIEEHRQDTLDIIKGLLEAGKVKRLGFENELMSYSTYVKYSEALKPFELVPASGLVEEIRMFKDEEELAVMKEAADVADRAFLHMIDVIKPGITELDGALELEFFMRKNGASATSFDTIFASGERSALPHGAASSKVVGTGELLTMDFGALLKGYCSDITRTVMVGKPSEKQQEIYNIVLEAQLHTLEHLRPGMTGREADALARDVITRHGYGDQFGHSTGHGLGMEVHEAPNLSKVSDTVLKPGMVVTVEPGIYIPGFGGVRIEDDVVITETGVRRLTESTKELIIL